MRVVRLRHKQGALNAGELAGFPDRQAARLVKAGAATAVTTPGEPTKPAAAGKPVRRRAARKRTAR